MWREIPQVSPCANTKMSSPRLLIYYFTHSQFLQILLSWYESWGTKNIFLSMQYFKLIWIRKWRLPKCWQLIILSVWILRHQCSRHPSPKGSWKWQPKFPCSRFSASIRPLPSGGSPWSSAQLAPKWWKSGENSESGNWIHEFKSFYSYMKWMLAY